MLTELIQQSGSLAMIKTLVATLFIFVFLLQVLPSPLFFSDTLSEIC